MTTENEQTGGKNGSDAEGTGGVNSGQQVDWGEKIADLEAKMGTLAEENQLLRTAMVFRPGGAAAAEESEQEEDKDPYGGLFADQEDDDVITVGQAKKILDVNRDAQRKVSDDTRFLAENPDYKQVIDTYLPKVIKIDPSKAETIKDSRRPYATAYKFCKDMQKVIEAQEKSGKEKEVETVIENANKVKTAAGAGAGSASQLGDDRWGRASSDDVERKLAELKSRGVG